MDLRDAVWEQREENFRFKNELEKERKEASDHDLTEAMHKFEMQKLQEKLQIQPLEIKSLKMKSHWNWFSKILWFISIAFAKFVGRAMSGQWQA